MNVQKSFQAVNRESGSLYLVGTPIGNLEDMTFRAVRMLKEVQWIAAEDTRQTRKLLNHYDISTRLISYHEHNKRTSGPELVRKLLSGESIALVSDAGLPAISDPGAELVELATRQDIAVIPIPGANAALSALIVSGLPTERFLFVGFLPREKKKLVESLHMLKQAEETLICYEAPHRIIKTLKQIAELWGDRPIALARELTKKYEEIVRGTVKECLSWLQEHPPKGEYCVVIHGQINVVTETDGTWWSGFTIEQQVEHYESQGASRKEAIKKVAVDRKVPKREIYNELI